MVRDIWEDVAYLCTTSFRSTHQETVLMRKHASGMHHLGAVGDPSVSSLLVRGMLSVMRYWANPPYNLCTDGSIFPSHDSGVTFKDPPTHHHGVLTAYRRGGEATEKIKMNLMFLNLTTVSSQIALDHPQVHLRLLSNGPFQNQIPPTMPS